MAERVLLHIGLPKTATTYLQRVLWNNRDRLIADGVLLPGKVRRAHLWVTRLLRRDDEVGHLTEWQAGAWDRLRAEVEAWPGTALLSHEFFAAATEEQVAGFLAELAPAEVHVVVTAREPLGLFTASWQESLKNRSTEPMTTYAREVSEDPSDVWNWRTLDLGLVLDRWAPVGGPVAPEHVHVLPLPGPGHARDEIWRRFAGVLGVDPDAYDLSGVFPNESMGVAEAETLRRVNAHLDEFSRPIDKGTYIRSFLADERLVPRAGERFWPAADRVAECRRRGEAAYALVLERGYDVVGDATDLLVPDDVPPRRTPESVTDAEVARVATELVATMLGDVRSLRHERRDLQHRLAQAEKRLAVVEPALDRPAWRIGLSRARARWSK